MADLKDFISKKPISVIVGTEITDKKVKFQSAIDSVSFYKMFKEQIDQETFTTEKAMYTASLNKKSKFVGYKELLVSKVHF